MLKATGKTWQLIVKVSSFRLVSFKMKVVFKISVFFKAKLYKLESTAQWKTLELTWKFSSSFVKTGRRRSWRKRSAVKPRETKGKEGMMTAPLPAAAVMMTSHTFLMLSGQMTRPLIISRD